MIKKTITVALRPPCRIYIGPGALGDCRHLFDKEDLRQDIALVTTAAVHRLHGRDLLKQLRAADRRLLVLTVPDTEKSKSAHQALTLIKEITAFEGKKGLCLLAMGGGVVGDLTGFVASIYKRGTPYVQIPTTLLAQIDSSIGGKTAVDTAFGKNLIGSFYQPRFILSDTRLLSTLPLAERRNGLAEAVKYAAIEDPRLFAFIERDFRVLLKADPRSLAHLIARCAAIKAKLVSKDERDEKGIRAVLNFGHTFAHALEAASRYALSHGEAVSIGMVCACRLSEKQGWLCAETTQRVEGLLRQIGLPTSIGQIPIPAVMRAMQHDKKFNLGTNRFILLENIGKTRIERDICEPVIREVLRESAAAAS
jgi:3-dehydroquinate synthase